MKAIQTWRGRLQAIGLAAAAIALVAVANVAARQEAPGPGGRAMRGRMPFAQLDLSADQKTRIDGILEKHRQTDQSTFEQLRAAHESLRSAIYTTAAPDAAQIEDLTGRVAELEAQALRARVATQVEVASILTDDQRQTMASMRPAGPPHGRRE